jgi:hypothetical protein
MVVLVSGLTTPFVISIFIALKLLDYCWTTLLLVELLPRALWGGVYRRAFQYTAGTVSTLLDILFKGR